MLIKWLLEFFNNSKKRQIEILQRHFPGAGISKKTKWFQPQSLEVGKKYVFKRHNIGNVIVCAVVTVLSPPETVFVKVMVNEIVFKITGADQRYCQGKTISVLATALYLPSGK